MQNVQHDIRLAVQQYDVSSNHHVCAVWRWRRQNSHQFRRTRLYPLLAIQAVVYRSAPGVSLTPAAAGLSSLSPGASCSRARCTIRELLPDLDLCSIAHPDHHRACCALYLCPFPVRKSACNPAISRKPSATATIHFPVLIFRLRVLMFCPALDHRLLIQVSAPHLRLEVADSITTLS